MAMCGYWHAILGRSLVSMNDLFLICCCVVIKGIGRSASISSDRSVAPPPGFSGTNGYM